MENESKKKERRNINTDQTIKPKTEKPEEGKPKPSKQKQPEEPPTKRIVDSITVYL